MAVDYTEVLSDIDIADVIEKETGQEMLRKGNTVQTKCPFHGGSDSFYITYKYSDGGYFKCFNGACAKKGDTINFIQEYKNLTFQESLIYLKENYGLNIEISPEAVMKNKKKNRKEQIISLVEKYYHWNLYNHPKRTKALKYLKSRKISKKTIKDHKIGFAPFYDEKFIPFMKSKGVSKKELFELKLINKYKDGVYPFFRNRIMFGLYGRSLSNNGKLPHLYSSNQHTKLYNFDNIKELETIVVNEAHFDSISAEQVMKKNNLGQGLGFTAAYGTNGFKKEYVKSLKKTKVKNIILCYDYDIAGITAMIEDGYMLENEGYNVVLALLPYKNDVNKLLKYGQEKIIIDAIKNAKTSPLELDIKMILKKYGANKHNGRKNISLNQLDQIIKEVTPKIDKKLFKKDIKSYLLKRPLIAKIIVDEIFKEMTLDEEVKKELNAYYNKTIKILLSNNLKKIIKEE